MKIRVGLVYYPQLHQGGVEAHVASLIRQLPKYEIEIFILSDISEAFLKRIENFSVQIIPWKVGQIFNFKHYIQLQKIIKINQIDIIHIHNPAIALPVRILTTLSHTPTVITHHLILRDYFKSPNIKYKVIGWISQVLEIFQNYLFPHKLIFVSESARNYYLSHKFAPRKKTITIHNGISQNLLSSRQKDLGTLPFISPPNAFIITFIGRLEYQKGLDILIEALAYLDKLTNNFHVFFAGAGSLETFIKEMLEKNNLEDKVILLGHINNSRELLDASDVYVLPSRFEGMSIGLIEAAASGLPIIATDVGDNRVVVKNNYNGFLIPKEDPILLAHKLLALIANPDMLDRMGNNSRIIARQFDESSMVKQIVAIYHSFLNPK